MKRFFCATGLLVFVFITGCTSYRITSDPARAKVRYKGNITYKPPFPQYTPIKARKGIEWPYGYEYVAVEWPNGIYSDWRLLDKDQHFVQGRTASAVPVGEDVQFLDYTFDAASNRGFVSVDATAQGLVSRDKAIKKIGEICSSKNVLHVAGQENLKTDGHYRILDEKLENNILTITFEAVR